MASSYWAPGSRSFTWSATSSRGGARSWSPQSGRFDKAVPLNKCHSWVIDERHDERGQHMSKVRLLVGTRKGAFVLTSDGKRKRWKTSGPHFAGWEIYHIKG